VNAIHFIGSILQLSNKACFQSVLNRGEYEWDLFGLLH